MYVHCKLLYPYRAYVFIYYLQTDYENAIILITSRAVIESSNLLHAWYTNRINK